MKKFMSEEKFYKLFNKNSPKNKRGQETSLINRVFLRKFSHPIAYFCANKGIRANTISALMLILYLIGDLIFIFPTPFTIILLIFCYLIADLLDCVDGQLARYFGTYSKYGNILDNFIHTVSASFFAIAFGFRIFFQTENIIFLFLGSFAGAAYIFDGQWREISSPISKAGNKRINLLLVLKNLFSFFDDIPLFAILIFLLDILRPYTKEINLSAIMFIFYVVSILSIKVIYRLLFVFNKSSVVRKAWKGWSLS